MARRTAPRPAPHPEPATDDHLTPEQELDVALRTAGDFRTWISGADTKAGLLIPALGIGIGGAGNAMSGSHAAALQHGPLRAASLVLLGLLLCGALGALLHLAAVLTPRTGAPAGGANAFAFPSFRPAHGATATELCAQAWQQAEALAQIAATKYRRLRIALHCSCGALLAFLAWTALLAVR
ncbi:Pycsar system effector family protein [Saccharopolyspora gregorii]|uniref:Pycsar effector protein domain-containing protein n=1 Tax=Saccharopolyspora gregorii TaxID=33914 RepID=A0ABP6RWY9_9PSEU|nr:Pycsar system effector family protein [Saccharopolyspora gregorii]